MADGRKFIVGWLTCKPGKRDEFMAVARAYAQVSLAEDGCIFYEMNASGRSPDTVILTECFKNEAAHAAHLATPEFEAFFAELERLCLGGEFENVIADTVTSDTHRYG